MRILCLGDSIMQYNDFSTFPQTGWVQELARFFPDSTHWLNFARNGRSTKSFLSEGRFEMVLKEAQRGDFALIQFAHNDEKSADATRYTSPQKDGEFRKNLSFFIQKLREKGVFSVLLTPIARRMFKDGTIQNSHGDYPQAIIETAASEHVPCIDMTSLTMDFLSKTGFEKSQRFYMNFDAGLYDNFPDGRDDNSHLRPDGAYAFSKLCAHEIKKIAGQFSDYKVLSENCMSNCSGRFLEVGGENAEIDDEFLLTHAKV